MGWILLLSSVLCSTLIFVIFRFYEKFKVETLSAIVINYVVASGLSFYNIGEIPRISHITKTNWGWTALALGLVFILLFRLMAFCSQKIGISSTTIANKTTFVFPVIMGIFFLNEANQWPKFLGVILACGAVFLTAEGGMKTKVKYSFLWLLILFFGGGLLEILLGYAQDKLIPNGDEGLFTGFVFGFAGLLGFIIALVKKVNFGFKEIIGGIALGVPNYGSIYLFIVCLSYPNMEKSIAFPIANMGIIILGTILGMIMFKEKLSTKKIISISFALLAILAFSFSENIINAF